QKLFAVDLDFGAGILTEKNAVASLHIEREGLAFVVRLALANGDHFAFLWLLFCCVGNDDSATNGLALVYAADQDAIVQRMKGGGYSCSCHCGASPSREGLPRGIECLVFENYVL